MNTLIVLSALVAVAVAVPPAIVNYGVPSISHIDSRVIAPVALGHGGIALGHGGIIGNGGWGLGHGLAGPVVYGNGIGHGAVAYSSRIAHGAPLVHSAPIISRSYLAAPAVVKSYGGWGSPIVGGYGLAGHGWDNHGLAYGGKVW